MEQFLTFVVEMLFGYILVNAIIVLVAAIRYRRTMKTIASKVEAKVKDLRVELKVETQGDVAYFWDKASDRFIAQASNWEELSEHLHARKMQETIFVVDNEELSKVRWLQGRVKTVETKS